MVSRVHHEQRIFFFAGRRRREKDVILLATREEDFYEDEMRKGVKRTRLWDETNYWSHAVFLPKHSPFSLASNIFCNLWLWLLTVSIVYLILLFTNWLVKLTFFTQQQQQLTFFDCCFPTCCFRASLLLLPALHEWKDRKEEKDVCLWEPVLESMKSLPLTASITLTVISDHHTTSASCISWMQFAAFQRNNVGNFSSLERSIETVR